MAVSQDFIGSTQLGQVQAVTSSQIAATNAYLAALTKAATEILPPPINLPPSNITPTELPYGTQLGRLTVDTKTLTVSLAVPE